MPAAWIVLVVALWLIVVMVAVIVLGLIRRVNQLEVASTPTRKGSAPEARLVPGDQLPAVPGFDDLAPAEWRGRKRIVLFLSSTCGPCRQLAAELRDSSRGGDSPLSSGVELILVTDPDGRTSFADLGASATFVQSRSRLSAAWGIPGTPFALAVDGSGTITGAGFVRTRSGLIEVAGSLQTTVLR